MTHQELIFAAIRAERMVQDDQWAAMLREVTLERDALLNQQIALQGFCDAAIEEREALKRRVAELEQEREELLHLVG